VRGEQHDRIQALRRPARDAGAGGAAAAADGDGDGDGVRDWVRRALDATITRLATTASADPEAARLLHGELAQIYRVGVSAETIAASAGPALAPLLLADAHGAYERREAELSSAVMRELERRVCLSVIDRFWQGHLTALDDLFAGSTLHSLTGGDHLAHYRRQATRLFAELLENIDLEVVGYLFNLEVKVKSE
jgi:preprotein translocase subunit SecA